MRPIHRPVPPPAWRPVPGARAFAGFLGITLGTAINISLDYLYNNGYTVDGYGSDVVYLRNVNELNMIWPDATLHYGPGGLIASQYLYSTPYYDLSRYNMAYGQLTRLYGYPVTSSNSPSGTFSTWFGPNGSYIQLEYKPMSTPGGYYGYYTILQFG